MCVVRVIGAGFGRTGTLSLQAALERLGFAPCYHMTELMRRPSHAGFWREAVERLERGEGVDWDLLLGGYDATVDWPGCVFYEELLRAYPGSKVILSVREPEAWYGSAIGTIGQGWKDPSRNNTLLFRLLRALIPGLDRQVSAVEAVMHRRTFGKASVEEGIDREEAIGAFVRHNEEVRRRVPEDRLLVYSVKEGWGPLCAFLGVEEPDGPFPHVNDKENFSRTMSRNLVVGLARSAAPFAARATGVVVGGILASRLVKRLGSGA